MPTRRFLIALAAIVALVLAAALLLWPRTEPASAGIPTLLGDVNCDGGVAITDAQLIAQLIVGRISALDCPENADVNEDGGVTITDAQLIAQLIVGRISSLPPPAPPSGLQIQHCWLAIVTYRMVNPEALQAVNSCSVPGSPDYSCLIVSILVNCDPVGSLGWPSYSCVVVSILVNCDPVGSLGWPSYSCVVISILVNCNTVGLVGPSYSCALSGELVSCTSLSLDFPDFSCNRNGSLFTCE